MYSYRPNLCVQTSQKRTIRQLSEPLSPEGIAG